MSCKPEKVVEILHGMPCVNAPKNYYRTRKIARKKFDLDGRFVVLLFGIIFRKKGYENVILAARALLDLDETLMDKLIFLIVGAAIDEDSRKYFLYIENLSKKLKVDHIVKFVPKYVSDDEVCDYFTASEVLILPYTYYGGPSGVLELAFAYGTPVIAVRNNIAVSNGGFTQKKDDLPILYIENSNYKTIASTVLATFKNRKILRNLRRDIKLIREARSMDMIAKEHVKLYQSLFGNDGST
jgi:glycosyltransferase involved in cell wall biosynthesis